MYSTCKFVLRIFRYSCWKTRQRYWLQYDF